MTTARSIIKAALRKLNAASANSEPTAEDVDVALEALNALIDSKSNTLLNIHKILPYRFFFEAGKQDYELGPGGDWVVDRPMRIEKVNLMIAPKIDTGSTVSFVVSVNGGPPSASPAVIYQNDTACFTASPDADGGTYTWDFGDGSTGTGNPICHTYVVPGIYPVSATLTPAPGSGRQPVTTTIQDFITVQALPFQQYLDTFSTDLNLADHTADSGQSYTYYIYPGNPNVGNLENFVISGGQVTNDVRDDVTGSAQVTGYQIDLAPPDIFVEATALIPYPPVIDRNYRVYVDLIDSVTDEIFLEIEFGPSVFFETNTIYVFSKDYLLDSYTGDAGPVNTPVTVRAALSEGASKAQVFINGVAVTGVVDILPPDNPLLVRFNFDTNRSQGTGVFLQQIEVNAV